MSSAAIAGAGAGLAFHPDVKRKVKEFIWSEEIKKEINERRDRIKEKWGINVYFTPVDKLEMKDGYGGSELSPLQQRDSLEWIEHELTKYPPMFFKENVDIQYIRIVNCLKTKREDSANGFAALHYETSPSKQGINLGYRSKSHDFLKFEDVDRSRFAGTFHHELFHRFDYMTPIDNAEVWAPLNPEGQKAYYRDSKERKEIKLKKGFSDTYGQENEYEDKAVIYSRMMKNYKKLAEYCQKNDEILGRKVEFLKGILFHGTYGLMDEEYWQTDKSKIDEQYFKRKAEEIISLSYEEMLERYNKLVRDLPEDQRKPFPMREDDFEGFKKMLRSYYP